MDCEKANSSSKIQVNWFQAKRECRQLGLQLATELSKEEDKVIDGFIKEQSEHIDLN